VDAGLSGALDRRSRRRWPFRRRMALFNEATTLMQQTKERWCESEIYRIAGEVAIRSPNSDVCKAEAFFRHALEVAKAQQAKSYELRAATSLARLRRDQGRRDEALQQLAPIYNWYSEGFHTHDLRQAKALLDMLA
jgi:predicted ATPase